MEGLLEFFMTSEAWISLGILTFMEIVLGVDNILFISIVANKLKEEDRPKARNIGLLLAMLFRLILLFGITLIVQMQEPLFEVHIFGAHGAFTGQSLILLLGGLFLLYKSTTEIRHKLQGPNEANMDGKQFSSVTQVIIQICLINIVFSFDSILTAVGLTQDIDDKNFALVIMVLGILISMALMMAFAGPLGRFINNEPTIQMLGLSFLILIGFMLLMEGAHLAHLTKSEIPKGYLYFAIFFSFSVELLNMRMRKGGKPVQLHGAGEEAKERGIIE